MKRGRRVRALNARVDSVACELVFGYSSPSRNKPENGPTESFRMTEENPPTAPQPDPNAPQDRIENLNIEHELQESYLTYAMSTIMDRALPDVRDGLKPSQRRILVSMNDLNLGPRSKHLKCAKIAGNTSGDYHPHGESIVYPTLVRLAQEWSLRYPLIDGQGNFGSTDTPKPDRPRSKANCSPILNTTPSIFSRTTTND
jgi:hypothetical protein